MAYKNRFHSTTLGVDAQVFVGKAVEYTLQATLANFVANAVDGEVAIVKASDNTIALVAGGALAAGTEVYIAVKRGSGIETSSVFKLGTATLTKTAYVAPVKHAIKVTTGLTAVAKGDILELAVIETTPGMQPLPTTNYSVEVKAGETVAQAVARLIALINSSASIENQNKTQIVDAAAADAGVNITLTAKNFGEHFTVALRSKLAEAGSFAITAQFKLGNGTPEQVKIAEKAGDIRKGVTTNYPDQNATAEEFGRPDSFADANGAAAQYASYSVKFETSCPTPVLGKETRINRIFLFVPSNGAANPAAELVTILGA